RLVKLIFPSSLWTALQGRECGGLAAANAGKCGQRIVEATAAGPSFNEFTPVSRMDDGSCRSELSLDLLFPSPPTFASLTHLSERLVHRWATRQDLRKSRF